MKTVTGLVVLTASAVACVALALAPSADAASGAHAIAPAAPPSGSAAPAGQSPPPTTDEWNKVTGEVTVLGSSALACETKGLREWVRVSCRGDDKVRGKPTAVTVENSKGKEVLKFASGGVTSIVFRFEAGTKVEATFKWERLTKKFLSEWAPGAPKPNAVGQFL